jgi:hypothetical protein
LPFRLIIMSSSLLVDESVKIEKLSIAGDKAKFPVETEVHDIRKDEEENDIQQILKLFGLRSIRNGGR